MTDSRTKGQAGEREIATILRDLTGWQIKRKCRQHPGDSDLEGIPGWSVEVKRHASIDRGDIRRFWVQACRQAQNGDTPVLFYRRDRDDWRAVWPSGDSLRSDYEWTLEASPAVWAEYARERL